MARAPKPELVAVLLTASYSGHPDDPGPGGTIMLSPEDAAHVVASGGGSIIEKKIDDLQTV